MAGLLYFLEGAQGPINEGLLSKHAVTHLVDDQAPTHPSKGQVTTGPSGKPGLVLGFQDRMGDRSVGYYPKEQEWREIDRGEGKPKYWVGWYTDAPPTPDDLKRPHTLDSDPVRLHDNKQWLVPLLRRWSDEHGCVLDNLPRVMEKGPNGWRRGEVLPSYRALWEQHCRIFQHVLDSSQQADGDSVAVEWDDYFDHASALLRINYRLSDLDISALGLLSEERMGEVVRTSCNWEAISEGVERATGEEQGASPAKKNEGATDTPSSTRGDAA